MDAQGEQDRPPPVLGGGALNAMPPPVPQLPPQMFTTAAQLLDLTDSEYHPNEYLHSSEQYQTTRILADVCIGPEWQNDCPEAWADILG